LGYFLAAEIGKASNIEFHLDRQRVDAWQCKQLGRMETSMLRERALYIAVNGLEKGRHNRPITALDLSQNT
jgi:hypothetical protein